MSSNTLKLFNKFSNSLIKDFISHLESNDIQIPEEISTSFLVDKPSKRKGKLSPYTVFMKEFRSNYQKENPDMSFEEVSQAIAQEWSKIKENPEKFQEYEEKAQKYNTELPNKSKKICKATKGSDKQPCKAEAKSGSDFCGRHKKLAFDQVDIDDDVSSINSQSNSRDYLKCQKDDCSNTAESGPFCSSCSKKETKTKNCIQEKPNGQICGKKATKGNYCGFHNPDKPKKTKKKSKKSSSEDDTSSIASTHEPSIKETIMYYDENHNIFKSQPDNDCTRFVIYNDDIAYNSDGDEIGIIKNNKIELF